MITLSDGADSGAPPSAPVSPRPRRRRLLVGVVVVVVLAAAVGGGMLLADGSGSSDPTSSTTAGSSTSVPAGGGQLIKAATSSFTVGPTRPDLLENVGPMTVTKAGTVLANVHVNGTLTIAADNVTVRNFIASSVTQATKNGGVHDTVLEDGTIDGGGSTTNGSNGVEWSNYTARHLDITKSFDGMKAQGNVTIENCWIHDLNAQPSSDSAGGYTHNDGIQSSAGSHITIKDNRIERPGYNSAVFIDADEGNIDGVQVVGNYLDGGGYTLYVVQSRSAPQHGSPTNVVVDGNVFGKNHGFGPVTLAPGVIFRDNVDADNKPVPAHLDPLSK